MVCESCMLATSSPAAGESKRSSAARGVGWRSGLCASGFPALWRQTGIARRQITRARDCNAGWRPFGGCTGAGELRDPVVQILDELRGRRCAYETVSAPLTPWRLFCVGPRTQRAQGRASGGRGSGPRGMPSRQPPERGVVFDEEGAPHPWVERMRAARGFDPPSRLDPPYSWAVFRSNSHAAKQRMWTWNLSRPEMPLASRAN